jgi:hypothetical protein
MGLLLPPIAPNQAEARDACRLLARGLGAQVIIALPARKFHGRSSPWSVWPISLAVASATSRFPRSSARSEDRSRITLRGRRSSSWGRAAGRS